MTMNFYIGEEIKIYKKRFEKIQEYVNKSRVKAITRSGVFRWMIDEMYKSIINMEKKDAKKTTEK